MASLPLVLLILVGLGAQEPDPSPLPQAQSWRIASFLEEARLTDRAIFDCDFESDGTIWVAASDGLYRSHGYVWFRYTSDDGLPSDHVRSVLFDSRGTLWVGTENGAGTFDEQGFHPLAATGTLAGPSVRRIVEGPPGTLWFCSDRWPRPEVTAGLARFRDGEWTRYGVADGLPTDYVSDVYVDAAQGVNVMTRAGLAVMDGERFRRPLEEAGLEGAGEYMWSVTETPLGELLVFSDNHVFVRRGSSWSQRPEPMQPGHQVITTRDGAVLSFRPGSASVFLQLTDDGFQPASEPVAYTGKDVIQIAEAPDGAIWVAGLSLLVRWERQGGQWDVYADLPEPQLLDREGGLWFADDGEVLRKHGDEWRRFSGAHGPLEQTPESVWMHAEGGFFRWTPRSLTLVDGFETGLRDPRLVAVDGDGGIWVRGAAQAAGLGFSRYDGAAWRIAELPAAAAQGRLADAVADEGDGLWVVVVDEQGRNRLFHLSAEVAEIGLPPDYEDLQPPKVATLAAAELAVYGFFGMYRMRFGGGTWERVEPLSGRHVSSVRRWDDELWIGLTGSAGGLGSVTRDRSGELTRFHVFATAVSGTEADGAPLYAFKGGVFRTTKDNALSRLELPVSRRVDQALGDADGGLWIGTDEAVYHFRPDGVAPDTSIIDLPAEIRAGEELLVRFRGFERFRPSSEHTAYLCDVRIDGGEWLRLVTPERDQFRISGLALGPHRIEVRAVDAGGDVDVMPAIVSIDVKPISLQSRAWFQPALVGVFVVILTLAGFWLLAWRKLRIQARDLEQTVHLRTVELLGSERKYRNLFEDSQDAILLLDAEGRVEASNPAAEDLLASTRANLVGQRIEALFDQPQRISDLLETRARTGFSSEPVTRSAQRQHILLSGNVRRSETGEIVGYQLLGRDRTRQVEMEEHLRETQKMEAVGRMAGGIAHDFNNILTAILGYCDLLTHQVAGNAKLEESLSVILDQARRAKALISQIQVFSRSHVAEPRVVSLNEVVAGAQDLLKTLIVGRIELALDPAVGQVRIDPSRLEQVVVNLAVNARDAMGEDGTISISTVVADALDGKAKRYVLVVEDNGRGMDEETRRKIFEPFFSTKPPGEGTGLGLAIVYGIVDQAGGSVHVESSPGAGTRFAIHFPACAEPADRPESPRESEELRRGSGSILVVEDEPSIRSLIRSSLEGVGYSVDDAADGKGALKRVALREDMYDLVISDIVMPNMDGTELLERVRDVYPETAFLFISGHPQFGGTPRTRQALRAPLLMKPFQPRTLIERVHALVLDDSRRLAGARSL